MDPRNFRSTDSIWTKVFSDLITRFEPKNFCIQLPNLDFRYCVQWPNLNQWRFRSKDSLFTKRNLDPKAQFNSRKPQSLIWIQRVLYSKIQLELKKSCSLDSSKQNLSSLRILEFISDFCLPLIHWIQTPGVNSTSNNLFYKFPYTHYVVYIWWRCIKLSIISSFTFCHCIRCKECYKNHSH